MKLVSTFLLFFISAFAFGEASSSYLQVKVKKGDALYRILAKYDLYQHKCNVESFYKINGMEDGQYLIAGKTYNLPLKKYEYNGTSIRSTVGIEDWDLAVAIQDYNKKIQTLGVKKTLFKEDKQLLVPYHLLGCENAESIAPAEKIEEAEPVVQYINTDIYFGSDAKIKKESEKLKGKVYYIISGHGGPDPGAMKKKDGHQLCEDEYAYDVSLRLAKNLLMHSATVHMIIQDKNDGIRDESFLNMDKDEVCVVGGAIPLNQTKRLRQRVDAVNKLYSKDKKVAGNSDYTVIAIHVDSRSTSTKQDVFFYYAPGSKSGKKEAIKLQDTFKEKYDIHRKGRGYSGSVSSRNLYVLRKTNPKAVFVELANIQNANNQKRILPYTNRQVLANWLFEGLTK